MLCRRCSFVCILFSLACTICFCASSKMYNFNCLAGRVVSSSTFFFAAIENVQKDYTICRMTVLKQLSLSRTHKIRVFCVRVPPLVGNSEPPQQQRQQQQQWQKHCQRPSGRLAFVVVAWSIRAAGYSVNDTHTNRLNNTTTELQKQRRTLYIFFWTYREANLLYFILLLLLVSLSAVPHPSPSLPPEHSFDFYFSLTVTLCSSSPHTAHLMIMIIAKIRWLWIIYTLFFYAKFYAFLKAKWLQNCHGVSQQRLTNHRVGII